MLSKTLAFVALVAGASAFVPVPAFAPAPAPAPAFAPAPAPAFAPAPAPVFAPAPAPAFAPAPAPGPSRQAAFVLNSQPGQPDFGELGWSYGGEDHTRDPNPQQDEDPRKSIPQGESFEEYMRSRGMGGN